MISFEGLEREHLKELLEWLEHPIAMELLFPRLIDARTALLNKLVRTDEKMSEANIYRGEIRAINRFIGLHDDLLEAIDSIPEENSSNKKKRLDNPA